MVSKPTPDVVKETSAVKTAVTAVVTAKASPAVAKPSVKPAAKPVAKPAAKAVVKPAAKPVAKTAAKPAVKVVAKPVAKPDAVKSAAKPVAKVEKVAKPKKAKQVRDSFTMPESEYALLAALKKRCIANGVAVKKSEVLRAAVISFSVQSDAVIVKALSALDVIKTGRPPKGQK